MARRLMGTLAIVATLAMVAPASAAAASDQPNACAGATVSSPKDRWLAGTLSARTDVDWFRFYLGATRGVIVTLGDLPADYRISLWSSCSTMLATSDLSGVQFEEITKRLPAGVYRVRVSSAERATSVSQYQLRFRVFKDGLWILSHRMWEGGGRREWSGEVWNNTSSTRNRLHGRARYYDAAGNLLRQVRGVSSPGDIAAGGRAPFRFFEFEAIEIYDHYQVAMEGQTTTALPSSYGLKLTPGTTWNDGTYRHDTVTVKNTLSTLIPFYHVAIGFYDARGGHISVGNSGFDSDLQPGESRLYEIVSMPPDRPVNRIWFYGSRAAS